AVVVSAVAFYALPVVSLVRLYALARAGRRTRAVILAVVVARAHGAAGPAVLAFVASVAAGTLVRAAVAVLVVLRPDLHLRAASLRASLRFLTTARGGAALRGPGVLLRPALLRLRAALRALRRLLRTLAALRAAGLLRLTALGATRALCLLRRTGRCTAGL